MRIRGKPPKRNGLRGSAGKVATLCAVVLLVGCEERDRLTFPTPSDGVGPITMIDQPNGSDTTVSAGAEFFINGRTIDPDGVDTVYFLVTGGNQTFQPFVPRPPSDSVRFGLPLTTTGRSGDTMLVQIHGVDSQGNRGNTAIREVVVE